MAADAFFAVEIWLAVGVESEGLMATVSARDITTAAADAFRAVELREYFGAAVEIERKHEVRQLFTYYLFYRVEAALGEVMCHAGDEVVDDSVAVLHHGGAHLHVAAAELQELQGVAPSLDASDAADFTVIANFLIENDRSLRDFQDETQGDRLDGLPRITRHGVFATDISQRRHRY